MLMQIIPTSKESGTTPLNNWEVPAVYLRYLKSLVVALEVLQIWHKHTIIYGQPNHENIKIDSGVGISISTLGIILAWDWSEKIIYLTG